MKMVARVKKFIELLRAGKGQILEPVKLDQPPSMYRTTHRLGSDRIANDDEVYMLTWAQQYRPMRINGTLVRASYCAYRGLGGPLRIKQPVGIPMTGSLMQANLDHIVPRSKNGEEHPLNYQLLASWYNSINFKGGLPTFHARWHAFRKGGEIDNLPFTELADVFFWVFENYHSHKELRYLLGNDLCFAWPWWARESTPPYLPILHGYSRKRRTMFASKEESYLMEFSSLAGNVLLYLKEVGGSPYGGTVHAMFEQSYNMTPEVLSSFSRLRQES